MTVTPTESDQVPATIAVLMHELFAKQGALTAWHAELIHVGSGTCEVVLPMSAVVTQQHGYFHGGVIATIADVAGGYAANTLLLPTHECLSAEFKINIVSPGIGQFLIGRGRVIKSGKTLVVASADVFVVNHGIEKLCAVMQQTLFVIPAK